MIQHKCSICGKDLMSNEGKDADGKLIEPQVKYWAHDPRNLHVDVLTEAHEDCFKKVKEAYPYFDKPIEDYATFTYKTIDDKGVIVEKTPDKFKTDEDKIYADEKAKISIK